VDSFVIEGPGSILGPETDYPDRFFMFLPGPFAVLYVEIGSNCFHTLPTSSLTVIVPLCG